MTEQKDSVPNRLLLIDDEPMIVATISDFLRGAGFEVTFATVASDAIESVRRGRFALTIVDYAMPGLNGLEAAVLFAQLRQPFMFFSAYSDEALVSAAIAAGALAYVVKPIDPIHLVPTIRTAIQRAREIAALVEQVERLTRTIDTNRDVSVAVGLLMAQRGLPRQAAYDTLRQHARRTRRRLADLAAEVSAGAQALFNIPTLEQTDRRNAKSGTEPDDSAS
ncbi:MAG: ANTAR domain-containing response regulator [Steroidobacteraceae bacterium]